MIFLNSCAEHVLTAILLNVLKQTADLVRGRFIVLTDIHIYIKDKHRKQRHSLCEAR